MEVHMKRFVTMFLMLVLLMTLATPALAAGRQPGKGEGTFTLTGRITALDAATGVVSVEVAAGNTLVKAYVGQTIDIVTTPNTSFLLKTDTTAQTITFADLMIDDAISVTGTFASGIWTAARITTGASLVHFP
jgi:hypothetical protein